MSKKSKLPGNIVLKPNFKDNKDFYIGGKLDGDHRQKADAIKAHYNIKGDSEFLTIAIDAIYEPISKQ